MSDVSKSFRSFQVLAALHDRAKKRYVKHKQFRAEKCNMRDAKICRNFGRRKN